MNIRITNLDATRKIKCIKACRFAFGLSLLEAKDLVEAKMTQLKLGETLLIIDGELSDQPRLGMEAPPTVDHIRNYIKEAHVNFLGEAYCNYGCEMPDASVSEINDKIETDGTQLFSVPNTPEGNKFLDSLSAYTNFPKFNLKKRGRGTRKDHGNGQDISIKHSEWIAVYATEKDQTPTHLMSESLNFKNSLIAANEDLKKVTEENYALKREINELATTDGEAKILLDKYAETFEKNRQDRVKADTVIAQIDDDKSALNIMIDKLEEKNRELEDKNKALAVTIDGLDVILKNVTTTPTSSKEQVNASITIDGHTIEVSGATAISINK